MMKHRLGYACINLTTGIPLNRTCRLANATDLRLRELIKSNLDGLMQVLEWNKENNIYHFRISSDIIPFASHEINKIEWWKDFKDEFPAIGTYIKENNFRVAMHPSPVVYLNSPRPEVVKSSIKELEWHIRFLDALELDSSHKIVFHAGGVYGDKTEAIKRFIKVYKELPKNFKARLTLENDDKNYNVWDLTKINEAVGIPLVFDNLHHEVLNTQQPRDKDIEAILKTFFSTWDNKTEIPDIHYSTQKEASRSGSHSESINLQEFKEFFLKYLHLNFDIMFETKDKDKSVLSAYKMFKTDPDFKHVEL